MTTKTKQIVFGVACLVVVLLLLVLLLIPRNSISEDIPADSGTTDYSKQANIIYDGDVFEITEGLDGVDSFARDLFVFATSAYPEYKDLSEKIVAFRIDDWSQEEEIKKINGRFGSINSRIEIELTVLNNDKIKTSIRDTATDLNIDEALPSNTDRNIFIGALPVYEDTFNIEYDQAESSFIVFLDAYTPEDLDAAYDAAAALFFEGLGISSLSQEDIQIIRPDFQY